MLIIKINNNNNIIRQIKTKSEVKLRAIAHKMLVKWNIFLRLSQFVATRFVCDSCRAEIKRRLTESFHIQVP